MPDITQTTFDEAYWESKPPSIQKLRDLDVTDGPLGALTGSTRYKAALALANQGFVVDVPIMIWGWDPYLTMQLRQTYGFSVVPSALGAMNIKVSTDLADYPPMVPPPPPPAPPTNPVGPCSVGDIYLSVAGDTSPDQAKHSDARGTFIKHVVLTPFGTESYWEKIG